MHDIFISCFLLVLWFACAKTMPSQLQGRFRRPGLRPLGDGPRGPRRPGPGPASSDGAAAGRVRGGLGSGPLARLGSAAPFSQAWLLRRHGAISFPSLETGVFFFDKGTVGSESLEARRSLVSSLGR